MNKDIKQYLIFAGIATAISVATVWASNNVDVVEDAIG